MGTVACGIALPNYGRLATSQNLLRLTGAAEDRGFDSVWVSDHLVVPAQIGSLYPYDASPQPQAADLRNLEHCFEPLSTLAFLAGASTRIRLGVSVYVVPLRNPVLTAKMIASIDALSGGRMIFGCGVGWLREEFEVMHASAFEERGRITDAYLGVCKAVWTQALVRCTDPAYQTLEFRAAPKPPQGHDLPLWIGGNSRAAMARAVRLGNGWHPIDLSPDELREKLETLRQLCADYGRPADEITVSLRHSLHLFDDGTTGDDWLAGDRSKVADDIAAYGAAGLDYLVVNLRHARDVDGVLDQLDRLTRVLEA